MSKGKVYLVGNHSVVEPLGLMTLAAIVRQEGFEPVIRLARDGNYAPILAEIQSVRPAFVGATAFTGGHIKAYEFLDSVGRLGIETMAGGPHPTYFPNEAAAHARYTVVSQGMEPLRRILRYEAAPGILIPRENEDLPTPDRADFYRDHPAHRDSFIKSILTSTGCFYRCGHCHNGSSLDDVLSAPHAAQMRSVFGDTTRLFVQSQRSVDDVLAEMEMTRELAPTTSRWFFQDDMFGTNLDWLQEFARKYDGRTPYTAQTRLEFINPGTKHGQERVALLKASGCTDISLAIESSNPVIRHELLNRKMPQQLILDGVGYLAREGLDFRTQQMLAFPLGATEKETPMGLDADGETLGLSVRLREIAGKPFHAWYSILVPEPGTPIGDYSIAHGHFKPGEVEIPSSFFGGSIMNFARDWVGPGLSAETPGAWLDESERAAYVADSLDLRHCASLFSLLPDGNSLAQDFLARRDRSAGKLVEMIGNHLGGSSPADFIPGWPGIQAGLSESSTIEDLGRLVKQGLNSFVYRER